MDTYELAELYLRRQEQAIRLTFADARLAVVTEAGSRLWYIDVNGVVQTGLLAQLAESDNLRFELTAVTAGGRKFEGVGYLHPNVKHQAAAIRGDGELTGYSA